MSVLSYARRSIPADENSPPRPFAREWPIALLAIAVFSLMSITMAVVSVGFLEGDACSHFLTAQAAFADPTYLVNVWGRPVCTALYALPVHFSGRLGARLSSLVTAIVISLLTRSIARGQGWRWPTLALMFVLAQPLVFLHSFSELTELPFALLIALGFLAYQRRQFFCLALVMGFGPLSRPEGFGFLALTLLALVLHRRWWWSVLAVAPLILWDYFGWRLNGCPGHWWTWLHDNWPYSQDSLYEKGPALYFVEYLPAVVSPFLFPATVVGIARCLMGQIFAGWVGLIREAIGNNHLRRCEILITVLPLMILAGHSFLYWRGKMASNGELRYMMVVAPFWALLSARGWSWIFAAMNWRRPFLWASLAVMLPVLVNRAWTVIPMDYGPDWLEAKQIAIWYKANPIHNDYPYLDISHVGLQFFLNFDPQSGRLRPWTKTVIDSRPPGTLLIWDRVGALFNSDAQRKVPLDEIRAAGWRPIKLRWTNGAGEWQFFESDPVRDSARTASKKPL